MLGDACEKYGFTCPALPESLIKKIESFRRGGVIRMTNPMDFGDIHSIEALIFALKECLALDNIDGMVLSIMYGPEIAKMFGKEMTRLDKLLDIFTQISKEANKPIGLSFFTERRYIERLKAVNTFPVFDNPEESVLAIKMLWDYSRKKIFTQTGKKNDQSCIQFIKNRNIINERSALSEYESKQFLSSYKIPVTREIQVTNKVSLIEAAKIIGYPIVLKGCSPDILHKTEKKLIGIDIKNEDEALTAFKKISSRMNGTENTIIVQEMVKGKQELVVGLINDPHFGPCVMFGLGGIFAEILKDVSFRVAPLDPCDALEMINEIKGSKILSGVRGMEVVDMKILTDILLTIGKIGMENEAIKEIDINPLIISGNKPVAVDALVVSKA